MVWLSVVETGVELDEEDVGVVYGERLVWLSVVLSVLEAEIELDDVVLGTAAEV